jgi:hypothetical protein
MTLFHFNDITRVEVIDRNGRAYVAADAGDTHLAIQDEGKTLKIFHRGGFNTTPQQE